MLIEIVGGSGAPWWGVPVIAGIFLISGAFLGFFLNRANDSRRTRREDEQRWDRDLLGRAVDVVTALHVLYEANYEHQKALFSGQALKKAVVSVEDASREAEANASSAIRGYLAATNALLMIAPDNITQLLDAFTTEFSKVQAKSARTALPPLSPDHDQLGEFVLTVRSAAGVTGIVLRKQAKS